MNLYKPENIKANVRISQYLADQGVKMQGNRAVATWREGERMSVSFDDEKGLWHDFVSEEGGDIIALCIKIEGGSFISACHELGDRYHLTPDKTSRKPPQTSRHDWLLQNGYALVKTYVYTDEAGNPLHYAERFERTEADGKRVKEFSQGRYENGRQIEKLGDMATVLYNLPNVVKAEGDVYLVEGEKDADTLNGLGLVATTNAGGCKHWTDDLAARLKDKHVVIIADNDKDGQEGARKRATSVVRVAASVKVITISKLPKGDVTDWIEREGGTVEELRKEVAKAANVNSDIYNYTEREEPYTDSKGKAKKRTVYDPILLDDIIANIRNHFGDWPRRLGSSLFYVNDVKKEIVELADQSDLTSWIKGEGRCNVFFMKGPGMSSEKEIVSRLRSTAKAYQGASVAPFYPDREDIYPLYDDLPPPSEGHQYFNKLIDAFLPATDADKTLIKALFATPMWFRPGCIRPWWVIDTVDAQQSGKSTIWKLLKLLYRQTHIPLREDKKNGGFDTQQLIKQVLSASGRQSRIVVLDNLTTTLKGGGPASMATDDEISGMAPYGHGTESRLNDLTFIVTVNGGKTDSDMARRSYHLYIRCPDPDADPLWEKKLREFIEANRPQILADIRDLLAHGKRRYRKFRSGFCDFDAEVLSPVCDSDEEFEAADLAIARAADACNEDVELAELFNAILRNQLVNADQSLPVVISPEATNYMVTPKDGSRTSLTPKKVRELALLGKLDNIASARDFRMNNRRGYLFYGMDRCSPGHTSYQLLDLAYAENELKLTTPAQKIQRPTR